MSGSCHLTERQMLKLVLNVKYLLLLSFLTAVEFYNSSNYFQRFVLLSDLILMSAEKIKTKIQN